MPFTSLVADADSSVACISDGDRRQSAADQRLTPLREIAA
jgi:hypothetical protein